MPQRDVDLDRTTQTDLLYGQALEDYADVATLAAELAEAADDAHLSPIVYDHDSEVIRQHAATCADSSLSHSLAPGSTMAPGGKWSYLHGIAPAKERIEVHDSPAQRTWPQYFRRLQRRTLALQISLGVHTVLGAALLLMVVPGANPVTRSIVEAQASSLPTPLETVEIPALPSLADASALDVSLTAPRAPVDLALTETSLTDPGLMPSPGSDAPIAAAGTRFHGPVSDVRAIVDNNIGRGKAQAGEGRGGAGAEFYGTKAEGNRFVFVVDCSLSMAEKNRWNDAATELVAAIERLQEDQLFYVVLFDGAAHRMFNHDEYQAGFFPATKANKLRFQQWLISARLGYETRPFMAMRTAFALAPDAIYLLSDGEFDDGTSEFLKKYNRDYDAKGKRIHRVIVHTFNMHNHKGEAKMRRMAADNGGKYVFLPAK